MVDTPASLHRRRRDEGAEPPEHTHQQLHRKALSSRLVCAPPFHPTATSSTDSLLVSLTPTFYKNLRRFMRARKHLTPAREHEGQHPLRTHNTASGKGWSTRRCGIGRSSARLFSSQLPANPRVNDQTATSSARLSALRRHSRRTTITSLVSSHSPLTQQASAIRLRQ
ncbi:hypothetical protein K438DRAFT_1975147 [Mycena galopus ATCC 62051]|nr:hypothetical protein K438DRAFT_1975147 [Mycena galopus ATCC 62051]